MIRRTLSLLLLLGCCISPSAAEKLELRENDHIAVIGNTLADRMQHSGWLESLIHSKFPGHNLVVRHLGFSGDELTMRHRSQDFGSPDEWQKNEFPIGDVVEEDQEKGIHAYMHASEEFTSSTTEVRFKTKKVCSNCYRPFKKCQVFRQKSLKSYI